MSIILKSPKEIEILREGGKRLSHVLDVVESAVRPGVTTKELDTIAYNTVIEMGDTPAFLNYQPYGADFPYPATICLSTNDQIVHGLPQEERILVEGDIIGLDMGIIHGGLITDSARTVGVGKVSEKAQKLMDATKKSLEIGIAAIKIGGHVGDVGYAIEKFARPLKYGIVRELGGHGVGREVHEDPYIPNFGTKKGMGAKWKVGMVVAIEPMLNEGKRGIVLDKDGYTYRTADKTLSAHFEHTIAITKDGVEVLTKHPKT